jgi:hypothetical protein
MDGKVKDRYKLIDHKTVGTGDIQCTRVNIDREISDHVTRQIRVKRDMHFNFRDGTFVGDPQELKNALLGAWSLIPQDTVNRLCMNLPRRPSFGS